MSKHVGQVKWFNRQTGWGFITICGDDTQHNDIFVHWKSLDIATEQFKYLVAGEYVELDIKHDPSNEKHPYTAENVTGIRGGLLMCQFRQLEEKNSDNRVRSNRRPQRSQRKVGDIVMN